MSCSENNNEKFYAASPNYCRDTPLSSLLHPGRRCYRSVPIRSPLLGVLPGDQVCFDDRGNCSDSPDLRSPVDSRSYNGNCSFSAVGSIEHFLVDMVPILPLVVMAFVIDCAVKAK